MAAVLCCACGAEEKKTADMNGLRDAMLAADPSLPEMISVSDEEDDAETLFAYLSNMDYKKVEHFLLSYSAEGKADEIAVVAVRDPADAEEAEASLQAHVDSRLKLLREYEPEEASRLEKVRIFTKDQYAVLISCDNSDKVKTEFNKYIDK